MKTSVKLEVYILLAHFKVNKAGNAHTMLTPRRVHKPLLPWKSNKYSVLCARMVCVCVYVCVRVRVCILALVVRQANRVFSASYDIVIRSLSSSTVYSHSLINGTIF